MQPSMPSGTDPNRFNPPAPGQPGHTGPQSMAYGQPQQYQQNARPPYPPQTMPGQSPYQAGPPGPVPSYPGGPAIPQMNHPPPQFPPAPMAAPQQQTQYGAPSQPQQQIPAPRMPYPPQQPMAATYPSGPGPVMPQAPPSYPQPGPYSAGPAPVSPHSAPMQQYNQMPGRGPIPPPGAPLPGTSPYGAPHQPYMAPQQQQQQAQPPQNRINPSMIPSPVTVNEADQSKFNETAFVTSTLGSQSPPLPSTMARYIDDGNSSSRFMRLTTNIIPCTEDLMHASRMPLALVMQPFAQRPPYEEPIPLVDFGPDGPVRCNRCRAYMNPFMTFGKGGRVFSCNICFMQNDVRDSYFCNLDMMSRRVDASSRPELMYGTVDIVAPADYLLKKPSKATILFALETSRASVQTGAFMAYVQTVKQFLLNPVTAQRYSRVGIITFDKNVQFYDLRATLNEPQLMIMSDVSEPFVPLSSGLFFDPTESREIALSLLERLPKLFQEAKCVEACFGAAASAGYEAMKATGGRVVIMTSTLPSYGVGALKAKDVSAGPAAADKVHPALVPQGDFYRELGKKCAASAVSVNIVATPSSSIDMATINDLCKYTSGSSHVYAKFSFDAHMKQLCEDTVKGLLRPAAYDCLAKLRCGSGLQNDLNFGQFILNDAGDLRFACLDSEQTFATTFVYDSKLQEGDKLAFQLAVLYTTSDGQPRIRIHNLSLIASMDIANIFKMADLDAVVNVQVKQAASQLQDHPLQFLATQVSSKCSHILAAYRKHCAQNMSTGQLVLPDALKLLPLYASCILKQPAFQANFANVDYRVSSALELVSASMDSLPTLLYPRLFALHHIVDSDQSRYYPPCLRLSRDSIQLDGIYLMENSQRLVIWVGSQVESGLLEKIFGVPQLNAINANLAALPELNNEISSRIRTLLQKIQHQRSHHLGLSIIRSGIDPWEMEWAQMLVEEPQSTIPSYVDFLCRIHSQIQQELTSGPSLSERAAMLNFLH